MLYAFKLIRETLSRPEWCKASKRTHSFLLENRQVRIETLVCQIKGKKRSTHNILQYKIHHSIFETYAYIFILINYLES